MIEAEGWEFKDQRGSHAQFRHSSREGKTTVPHPLKDASIKTIISIERPSGLKLRKRQ